jgi:damage-control phosphatase, subfamily I
LKPKSECASCLLSWVCERSGVLANEEGRLRLTKTLLEILSREFNSEINVGSLSNKLTDAIPNYLSQSSKYYQTLKRKNNQLTKKLLGSAKTYIKKGRTLQEKFERACSLASASNVAPMSVPAEAFAFQEVKRILRRKKPFPAMKGPLFREAQKASHILYIADNAGEIGFDSLLMACLKEMGSKICLIVKEGPFFEDATMEDVLFFNVDQLVDRIFTLNGFFVPKEIPPVLMNLYKESNLIISKGTGNYEALKGEVEGKTAIYMLKIKCRPIAKEIGADIGSFVVKLEK